MNCITFAKALHGFVSDSWAFLLLRMSKYKKIPSCCWGSEVLQLSTSII